MTYLMENAPRNSAAGKTFRARLQVLRRIIGANIAQVRKDQDMDIETLRAKTGIKIRKLKYWEAGRMEITLAGIIRIAAALDAPPSRLLRTRDVAEPAPMDEIEEEVEEEDADKEDDPEEEITQKDWIDEWVDDLEVQIYQKVAKRERQPEGMPGSSALVAMEEPLLRVMRSSVLFYDYATALESTGEETPAAGLVFLSEAMKREADRLVRLYYGHRA